MTGKQAHTQAGGARNRASFAAALCNVLGVVLLVGVIGLCVPLTVPRFMGYQVFDVVSGSMEPQIPVGSVVYVESADPAAVQEGDVIAFADASGTVVHRVTINRTSLGEFVTKGDANNVEDLSPVPYEAFIGSVAFTVPYLGAFMAIYATPMGKVYLLLVAACGLMFNALAARIRASRRRARELQELADELFRRPGGEAQAAGAPGGVSSQMPPAQELRPKRRGRGLRIALAVVLGAVFVGSSGVVGFVTWQHAQSDAVFAQAAERYTHPTDPESAANLPMPPIEVDFAALQAENPDVVGWIYCEDTPIDYPVLQGATNDQYLHADYTGAYNIDGSIFVDADNRPGFADSNTIIYGHHMYSGSMFAELIKWADQSFYEDHPVLWLLTPEQNYRLVVFSAHHANAHSNYYNIIKSPGQDLDVFLSGAASESDIAISEETAAELLGQGAQPTTYGDLRLDPKAHYVMLTTCAYLFDDDRYVLHCLLTLAGKTTGT